MREYQKRRKQREREIKLDTGETRKNGWKRETDLSIAVRKGKGENKYGNGEQ